jgi:putative flippase GtrA
MKSAPNPNGAPQTSGWAHWIGFVVSGTLSFVVDGGMLKLLTVLLGTPVLPARILSIGTAMTVGWLLHRTFTFRIQAPPTFAEFGRFIGVAWSSAVVNYLIFVGLLYIWPRLEPLIGVFIAGLFAMVWSYLGLRFAAFRKSGG